MSRDPQASENFWEGSDGQGIYWAISEDGGASWGGQEILVPAPDSLPAWGPVLHTEVCSSDYLDTACVALVASFLTCTEPDRCLQHMVGVQLGLVYCWAQ